LRAQRIEASALAANRWLALDQRKTEAESRHRPPQLVQRTRERAKSPLESPPSEGKDEARSEREPERCDDKWLPAGHSAGSVSR
jgi:hypothetical protein